MVKFPAWVSLPRAQSKEDLARKRIRYLLLRASIESTEGGNFTSFAERVGIDRSQVHIYAGKGRFNIQMAEACERVFGRDLIRKEWLIFPLDIPTE